MFALTVAEVEKGSGTIQGILSFYNHDVRVLFDTGSTHSFISLHAVCYVPHSWVSLPFHLVVSIPGSDELWGNNVLLDCEIKVHDRKFL